MRSLRFPPPDGDAERPDTGRGSDEPAAREMAELLARVAECPDPGVLLGLEGQSAALYFANFARMLKARPRARPLTSPRGTAARPATR